MQMILARHGNTFERNQPAVWVGSQQDLPLVAAGIQQANTLAQSIRDAGITLKAIYCGPLQRTRQYADIVSEALSCGLQPIVDDSLNELDYGDWSGLTNDQIHAILPDDLAAWTTSCRWPQHSHWGSSEAVVYQQVIDFSANLATIYASNDHVLVISSNGRLRYFLKLIPDAFETYVKHDAVKIKTGHICQLQKKNNRWKLSYWNQPPNAQLFFH